MPAFRRRVKLALERIEAALAEESSSYISWSGGKDSTVLLDLVHRVNPSVPVLHVRSDIEYPDCEAFVDQFIADRELNAVIVRGPSAWQVLVEEGGPFGQVNVATSRIDRECFFEPIASEVRSRGFGQVFLGLRAEESRARMMNVLAHGVRYYHKSRGLWTCLPLSSWTGKDVFAYHVERRLPWSPIYERTYLHPDPERIREGWWTTGEVAHAHGMNAWLRYHYPELWRRAVDQWPQFGA